MAIDATSTCPVCGGEIRPAAFECPHCGERLKGDASLPTGTAELLAERDELIASRKQNNLLGFLFGVPGLLLQIGGGALAAVEEVDPIIGLAVRLLGLVLLMMGLYFVARYKGRNGAWTLLGLIGCIGLLILLILKDFNKQRLDQINSQLTIAGHHTPPAV